MVSQDKLIKQGIYLTDNVFEEIIKRLSKGVKSSDTLEAFINKTKDYTMNNPLVVNGFKDDLLDIILRETNNHKFSRPAQKELVRLTIENRVGDLIVDVGDDIKESVRDIVKDGYNNNLSQDEIAENISHRVGVIKNTRARTIARTEIARTATASDYVINKERGATHFTVDCRDTCCPICRKDYNFGKVEYTIDQVEMLPPRHPNCRCYARFFKKEGFLTEKQNSLKSPFPTSSKEFTSLSVNLERSRIKASIIDFMDETDRNIVLDLLDDFRTGVDNVGYEWCTGRSMKGYVEGVYTDNKQDEVLLTNELEEKGLSEGLHTLIHNHIYGNAPFPSPEDFETFVEYKVKYGIVSNEFGIFIIKNNNYDVDLTSDEKDEIITTSTNIKKKMESDFQKDNPKYQGILEDDKDDDYYSEINDYVKQHQEKYVSLYQDCLSNHNMEAMFIKANKQK